MNNENTATAMVESRPSELETGSMILSITPEDLKNKITRDREMRAILTDYVQRELKEDHHYSRKIGTQTLAKPMLLQEGARNIVSLFNLFFGSPELVETYLEGGHYRVRAHVKVHNSRGEQVASGDGLCSTLESKYAYRKAERLCPDCGVAAIKKDNKTRDGGFYCWAKLDGCGNRFGLNDTRITEQTIGRVENQDKADVENTVLKMAIKRAKLAAVCDLPTISEIFAPEVGTKDDLTKQPAARGAELTSTKTSPVPQRGSEEGTVKSEESAVKVCGLIEKLKERGLAEEDLKTQFLPEGVGTFAELSDEQAAEIVPAVAALLTAQLKVK